MDSTPLTTSLVRADNSSLQICMSVQEITLIVKSKTMQRESAEKKLKILRTSKNI